MTRALGPWREHAACLDHDTDLWFEPAARDKAKRICREECPVRQECLEHALEAGERLGVWGGLDEEERAAIWAEARRARREARHA